MTAPAQIQIPNGMVVVTTYGTIQMETVAALLEMRSHTEAQGLRNAQWLFIPGGLVDQARNRAAATLLSQPQAQWLLFVDGDAVFPPDALLRLLGFAYHEAKDVCDAVGGYCTLRGEPYLPTIDTGTGTWEPWLPQQGPVEVMRTGSAFILLKRHVFERIEPPWYGTRAPLKPLDALAEVDNFAHTRFDGRNPLTQYPEWQSLYKCARDDASAGQKGWQPTFVGEDSNLCDSIRFRGMHIYVHTDIEVGHVDRVVLTAANHKELMAKREKQRKLLVGVVA